MPKYKLSTLFTECSSDRLSRVELPKNKRPLALQASWDALANWIEDTIGKKHQSVKVYNFFRFLVPSAAKQVVRATQLGASRHGTTTILDSQNGKAIPGFCPPNPPNSKPCMLITESYARQHGIERRDNARLRMLSEPVEDLNFSKLAIRYSNSLTKDLAFNCIRDIFSRIGHIVGSGGIVQLDLGTIGTFVSRDKKLSFVFSPHFLFQYKYIEALPDGVTSPRHGVKVSSATRVVKNGDQQLQSIQATGNHMHFDRATNETKLSSSSIIQHSSLPSSSSMNKPRVKQPSRKPSKSHGHLRRSNPNDKLVSDEFERSKQDSDETATLVSDANDQSCSFRRPSLDFSPLDSEVPDIPVSPINETKQKLKVSQNSAQDDFEFPSSPSKLLHQQWMTETSEGKEDEHIIRPRRKSVIQDAIRGEVEKHEELHRLQAERQRELLEQQLGQSFPRVAPSSTDHPRVRKILSLPKEVHHNSMDQGIDLKSTGQIDPLVAGTHNELATFLKHSHLPHTQNLGELHVTEKERSEVKQVWRSQQEAQGWQKSMHLEDDLGAKMWTAKAIGAPSLHIYTEEGTIPNDEDSKERLPCMSRSPVACRFTSFKGSKHYPRPQTAGDQLLSTSTLPSPTGKELGIRMIE